MILGINGGSGGIADSDSGSAVAMATAGGNTINFGTRGTVPQWAVWAGVGVALLYLLKKK